MFKMDKIMKNGWHALLIAMVGDLLLPFLLSIYYRGYDSSMMSISALGNPQSPVRIVFNLWMLIEGILFIVSLPVIYQHYHQVSKGLAKVLVTFMFVYAVGACIFTCFFSVNETKDVVTTASKIHGAGSVIGFMLFLFVPLLIAILSYKMKDKMTGGIAVVCFILALLFFVLFVMSDKPEFANTIIEKEGLWQRLNLLYMYIPIGMVAVKQIFKIRQK